MLKRMASTKYYLMLVGVFALFTVVLLTMIDYYYNRHVTAIIYDELASKALLKFHAQQRRLDEHLQQAKAALRTVSEDRVFTALTARGGAAPVHYDATPMASVLKMLPVAASICFIDVSGREKVRYEALPDGGVAQTAPRGGHAGHYAFKEAMARNAGQFYVSDFDPDREQGKATPKLEPTLRIALPVDSGDARRGLLVINIRAASMLLPEQFEDYFDFYTLDASQHFLYHPDPDKAWSGLRGTGYRFEGNLEVAESRGGVHRVNNRFMYPLKGLRSPVYMLAETKTSIIRLQRDMVRDHVATLRGSVLLFSLVTALAVALLLSRVYGKLADRNRRLEEALELLDTHILYAETDRQGRLVDVSSAFARRYGYEREEMIGRRDSIIQHPENPPEFYDALWESLRVGNAWQGEVRNIDRDGKACYFYRTVRPKYNSRREIVGYISTSIDVSESKEIEAQKEQLVFQSRHAIMGEMLSIIAHQWKQPLNHLSVELYNLFTIADRCSEDPEQTRAQYRHCEDILINLSEIIGTFQTFFKPNALSGPVSLSHAIAASQLLAASRIEQSGASVEVINQTERDTVTGVENEIVQSIVNLLHNATEEFARRSRPDPRIIVTLSNDKGSVQLEICDNGGGVPEEEIERLFDPYFTTKGDAGTGLGLYLVRTIVVEKLKGNLRAYNRNGGLCVRMILPLAEG